MKFKIFGTQISVTFLFTAFICLIVITDRSGCSLPMILAVIMHEMAHLLTMRLTKCNPKEIILIPGSIRIVSGIATKPSYEIAISLSGPLCNIMLFILFYLGFIISGNSRVLDFAVINLLIGVFNLLPVRGLDGGIILTKTLEIFISENKARIVVNTLAVVLAATLIFLGIRQLSFSNNNFTPIILGIYLILSVVIKF